MDRAEKKALLYQMQKYRANLSKDDRERVKAYDRARKARDAAEMTEEEKVERREMDKQRKAEERSQMSDEERAHRREIDRQRKALKRAEKREKEGKKKNAHFNGYKWEEKEHNRQYKIKKRKARSPEEVAYDNLKYLIRKRNFREKRTEERHKEDKVKAKEGMRKSRDFGYTKDLFRRSKTKHTDEDRLWRDFWDSSEAARKLLKEREPEIAARLEEEDKTEPDIAIRLAAEDAAKEEEIRKSNAERIKAWRKKKRLEIQKALDEPIILPDLEISEYERIRDENVKQLEEARKEFFNKL